MTCASVFFVFGGIFIEASWYWHLVLLVIPVIALSYFLFEAKESNKQLSDVRRELLKKYGDAAVNAELVTRR